MASGDRMRRILIIAVGLMVGFAAGSWTPLGGLAVDNAKALVAKSEGLSALVGLGNTSKRPSISTLSPVQMELNSLALSLAEVKFDTKGWPDISALMRAKAVPSDLTNGSRKKGDLYQLTPSAIAQIQFVIGAIEEENRMIQRELVGADQSFPETHFLRAVYESNVQMIHFLRFTVTTNNVGIDESDVAMLSLRMDDQKRRIMEATFLGRRTVKAHRSATDALTPTNETETNQRALAFDILDSYDVSFNVEDALAERLSDFPVILMAAMSGINVEGQLMAWDQDLQRLANDRMILQQYRHNLMMEFQASGLS